MAVTTRSAVDAILKNDYAPKLGDQLTSECLALKKFQKRKLPTQGRKMVWPARVRRGDGAMFIREDKALPSAGVQAYAEANLDQAILTSRAQISASTLASAKSDKGAFLSGVDAAGKYVKDDFAHALGTATFGYGGSGLKAAVAALTGTETGIYGTVNGAVAAATTVTVDNSDGQPGTSLLREGMSLAIGTAAQLAAGTADAATVDSITSETVFEVSASGTFADDDLIARGVAASNSYTADMNGLSHIVGNIGDLHGVSLSSYPEWKSTVDTNASARDLTSDVILGAVKSVAKNCGKEPDLLIMSYEQLGIYQSSLLDQQRYSQPKVDGGILTPLFANGLTRSMEIVVDRFCPADRVFGVNSEDIFMGEWQGVGFQERGGQLLQPIVNSLNYDLVYYGIFNMGTLVRNSHFVIEDLNRA